MPQLCPNRLSGTYPPEYTEAIAALKEQHKLELERLEQELRIGLQAEVNARAEAQTLEQIQSMHFLYKQQREQNIQLQQRLDEMEGLKKLETENQQLHQRIQELEHALQERPQQQWGNTMTQQTTKVLNKQVKEALEKTIDLRSLAVEPPKENAQECLRLMGMALKNLSVARAVPLAYGTTLRERGSKLAIWSPRVGLTREHAIGVAHNVPILNSYSLVINCH